eukprot:scaffold13697_cov20-Tisochrysis_lutea.AAC.2
MSFMSHGSLHSLAAIGMEESAWSAQQSRAGRHCTLDAAEEALGLSRQGHLRLGGEQPLLLPRKKRVIDTMRELGSSLER